MPIPDRREFLSTSSTAILCLSYPTDLFRPKVFVNPHDWLDIPYENQCYEIIGAANSGMSVLPNLDEALITETRRVNGANPTVEELHNLDLINGCGLFTIFVWTFPFWKKYRFWNYEDSCRPEYDVTYAG